MENQSDSQPRFEQAEDGSVTIDGRRFVPAAETGSGRHNQDRTDKITRFLGKESGSQVSRETPQISRRLQEIDENPENRNPFAFASSIFDPEDSQLQPAELWKIEQPDGYL